MDTTVLKYIRTVRIISSQLPNTCRDCHPVMQMSSGTYIDWMWTHSTG